MSLRHSVQVLPSDEKGNFYRNQAISASNFNFPNYFNFQSLYIKICPSAKTDRRIAFCYFLESLAQYASNESNPIALRHSVQVLPSDETGHIYRNKTILASNFNFTDYFKFWSLYKKMCPSAIRLPYVCYPFGIPSFCKPFVIRSRFSILLTSVIGPNLLIRTSTVLGLRSLLPNGVRSRL